MSSENNKVGRPTKYKPEMCETAIELMKAGASLVEVAAELGICAGTVHEWKKSNPDFAAAMQRGIELSRAWWEHQGRTNLENKSFNYVGWYMNMKNRFGWKDKSEVSGNATHQVKCIILQDDKTE